MYTAIILGFLIFPPIFAGAFSVYLIRRRKKNRRSPLSRKLLRSPGESLREEIEENMEKFESSFFRMIFLGLLPLGLLILLSKLQNGYVHYWQMAIALAIYVGLLVWATHHMYQTLKQRRNLSLGLDAELAVGQELNQLMLQGCRVYHDFFADKFNIDHIVVGPGGVYAVETKGRAKPDLGRGKADSKVVYEGNRLLFPDWTETAPLEQAKRQATWLSKWLSSAVGAPVVAMPALAIAGWFVEQTKPGEVRVFSGKNPIFMSRPNGRYSLSDQQITQIAHQIEQRCRDVEPTAYSK
jgi:hypothetical protein